MYIHTRCALVAYSATAVTIHSGLGYPYWILMLLVLPAMTHERLTCVRLSLMKLNSEVKHHNSSYIFNFLMSHTFTFVYVVFCGICSTDLAGGISGCGKMIEQERLSLHVYHRKSCSMMYMYITYYCVCV